MLGKLLLFIVAWAACPPGDALSILLRQPAPKREILHSPVFGPLRHAQLQRIEGRVINAKSHEPVPYATLGIKGKPIGTVASGKGDFAFTIQPGAVSATEKLVVSCIGFAGVSLPVTAFAQGPVEIKLEPLREELEAVTVRPGKVKVRKVGRAHGGGIVHLGYYTAYDSIEHDKLGREYGVILPLKEDCLLQDFNVYLTQNEFKSVSFRLNIYSVENGIPAEPLLQKDVIFTVENERRKWISVDLKKYSIFISGHDKIAVSMQWLTSVKADEDSRYFTLSVGYPSLFNSYIFREKSQDKWRVNSEGNPSMYLTVKYFYD